VYHQISTVEYVPDDIEAKQLRAIFDPARLDPHTGPESPELTVKWYRQDPHDWFRINYTDPNTGFHAGWTRMRTILISDTCISSTQPPIWRTAGDYIRTRDSLPILWKSLKSSSRTSVRPTSTRTRNHDSRYSRNRSEQSLSESFERYLQDKGKGRGGDGGNYRRNAARELERFAVWAAGDRGADDWTGIVPGDVDRAPHVRGPRRACLSGVRPASRR